MATGTLSIKLKCSSWPQLATIYRRDLSRGAMFLKASQPPPIGTAVRIDLTLPSSSVIALTGTVSQHVNDPQRGSGVLLELAPIPAGAVWMIESALATEANRPPPAPATGVPSAIPAQPSGPVPTLGEGEGQNLAVAEEELVRALAAEVESLRKLNPFLVLGIGYEASDSDVRAAFGDLTKRYHPDRFARYSSDKLRQVAAEIFILIRDAYRRLGDEASRAQVLATLGRAPVPRAIPATRPSPAPIGARASGAKPAQVPPLARTPAPVPRPAESAVSRVSAYAPTAAPLNEATTKKPEPLPPTSAGNELTTKKPEPLITAEARAAGTAPPPTDRHAVGSGSSAIPTATAAELEHGALEAMLDAGRFDEALSAYRVLSKRHPQDRTLRAGIELCEGLAALAQRDRLEAAQRFEAALEIDPSNERAARELAEMRRQATNERKGLLSRLMGKKE